MINQNETREQRILHISDRLLTKIEKSIDEIDRCIVKTKERTKNVEYDSDLKKPINETLLEKENVEITLGSVVTKITGEDELESIVINNTSCENSFYTLRRYRRKIWRSNECYQGCYIRRNYP